MTDHQHSDHQDSDHQDSDHQDSDHQGAADQDAADRNVTLADHLDALADEASGLASMLDAQHAAGGDIHPEALAKAARLETSLHQVIYALTHHEHLAMSADDVWKALNVEHTEREIRPD